MDLSEAQTKFVEIPWFRMFVDGHSEFMPQQNKCTGWRSAGVYQSLDKDNKETSEEAAGTPR